MYIFLVVFIWIIIEIFFLLTRRKPLSQRQIQKLSRKRTRKFIKRQFRFPARDVQVDQRFKSSLKPAGTLYSMNYSLAAFPAFVAMLLKGKKHEWAVLALADDTTVKYMWVNKGLDSKRVAFSCELDQMIRLCKSSHCHTILCLHNHPNNRPNAQTLLVASDQDKASARSCSQLTIGHGINWIDFVCERGNYLQYYSCFSPKFCPDCAKAENIQRENGVSLMKNYKLHRELGFLH